jgi:hypothetical protein
MGGKNQTQTSQSGQTYTPAGLSGLQDIWGRIQQATSQPYTPYGGELVAPVNAQQQTGISNINAAYGTAQPYINQAAGYAAQGAAPISSSAIQGYQNPYTQQVIDATQAQFNNSNAAQQSQLTGNAALRGALGGDRVGVAQAELAKQQNLTQNPVIANLYSNSYNNALSAAQADRTAQGQAAYTFGNLGTTAQNAALQGAQAQIGAGSLQQQTQQAGDTANYQQFLQQQAYPYQNAQFLASLGLPVLSGMGGSQSGTQTTTQPGPSIFGQIAGLGLSGLSLFSDEKVKENIEKVGKTFDGQNIYKFNYKGDPATHIGFIAQEIEKSKPDAVGDVGGVKTVNYDDATKDAAAKGKFADGGAVMPYNITDIMGYVPKTQMMGAAQSPLMSPMQTQQFRQSDSGLPSTSSMKDAAAGMKNIGGYFGDLFSPAQGGNYEANMLGPAMTGNTGMVIGGLKNGGRVDLMDTVHTIRNGLKKGGYADGGIIGDASPFDARWSGAMPSSTISSVPADVSLEKSPWSPLSNSADVPVPAPRPQPVTGLAQTPANMPVTPQTPTAGYSDNIGRYGSSIANIESGGRYDTLGPVIDKSGDRAYGKYQVMGANIPEWTQEILGKPMTPQEFLSNPQAQDAVFRGKFGQYVNKFGPEGAAKAWFAGESGMNNPNARDQLGTTVAGYAGKFLNNLGLPGGGQPIQTADDGNIPPNATLTQAQPQDKSSLGGWNPLSLSDEARQGLLAAGLGMMASKSPFALTQVGEGGLQGVKAYQDLKSAAADRAMKAKQLDLQAQNMARQADQFAQEFGLKKQQYSLQTMQPVKVGTDMMGRDIYAQRDPKTGQYINLQTGKPITESPQGPYIKPPTPQNPNAPVSDAGDESKIPSAARPTSSENPNVNPQVLEQLDPNIATQVKALSEGRMAFPSGFALKSPYWQQMVSLVSQYDPTFDAVNYNARAKTRNDFTSGKSAQNITSFNTAIGHLDTLDKAVDALNNTRFPYFNKIANWTATQTGDTKFQQAHKQFMTAKQAVVDELTRAFRGSGGNVHDIVEWEKAINDADSPQALHAATKSALELLHSRIESIGDQNNSGMGTTKDPIQMLSPKAQSAWRRMEGGEQPQGASPVTQNQATTVPSVADREKGKVYTTPKGQFRWNGAGWEKP